LNKLLLSIVFSVAVLTIVVPAQMAFAVTTTLDINNTGNACESIGGTWDSGSKTCTMNLAYTVAMGDILEIESGVTLVFNGSGNIGSGRLIIFGETINHGTINMNGGDGSNSGKISIVEGEGIVTNHGTINLNGGDGLGSGGIEARNLVTNHGTINLNGGEGPRSGSLDNERGAEVINECSGTINTQGGIGDVSGQLVNADELVTNHGTINLNGGQGSNSGDFRNIDTVDNSGTINEISAFFINDGTLNQILSPCIPVGGEMIPLDTSALLLAGAQMNAVWLIPVIVSAIGIGIVIARKF